MRSYELFGVLNQNSTGALFPLLPYTPYENNQ